MAPDVALSDGQADRHLPGAYRISPLEDSRWAGFVNGHPGSTVFHTAGWLDALRRTYGYEPVAFTSAAPGTELHDAVVFCRVKSLLTGNRLVSLPFSDHCQPLLAPNDGSRSLLLSIWSALKREKWKYVELRPVSFSSAELACLPDFSAATKFHLHRLDLSPELDSLFRGFHMSCIQRKIRRAQRENLTYEEGRSRLLLDQFYRLLVATRRRHRLPPQPLRWFSNLADCLGDHLTVRVASKDGLPIASILTIAFKTTVVYKYGCSDARFHHLGGMPLLFWETIQRAKESGYLELDLGRSDFENPGLSQFKSHLGAVSSTVSYYRYPAQSLAGARNHSVSDAFRNGLSHLPDWGLVSIGEIIYRHLA